MQDINFAPGSSPKRSRKQQKQDDAVEYHDVEKATAAKQPKAKDPASRFVPKPEAQKRKKQQAKKRQSFFEWRKKREASAQEKAEAREAKERAANEKKEAARKKEEQKQAARLAKAAKARRRAEAEQATASMPPLVEKKQRYHSAPQSDVAADAPDLSHATAATPAVPPVHEAPRQHPRPTPDMKLASAAPAPRPTKAKAKKPQPQKPQKQRPSGKVNMVPVQEEQVDVNLIPQDVLAELQTRNYLRDLLYVALTGVGITLLVFAGLNIYQSQISNDTIALEDQITSIDEQITTYTDLQTDSVELQERLVTLSEVLDNHVYWTPLLERVEALTLPTVYYQSMAGSAVSGEFIFDAVARDYAQIDAQVRVLRNDPLVESVTTTSAIQTAIGVDEEGEQSDVEPPVQFSMRVVFDAALFARAQ